MRLIHPAGCDCRARPAGTPAVHRLVVLILLVCGCAPGHPRVELFPEGSPAAADVPRVNVMAFADWGVGNPAQQRLAQSMGRYVKNWPAQFDAALVAGDNFYGRLRSVEDRAWRVLFERMYDPRRLDMPFYVVLGNHDYDDNKDLVQLEYARVNPQSRWKMPARWYRVDLPADEPLVTVLMLDSNHRLLSQQQWREQLQWLERELQNDRAAWTVAVAHHPLFSAGRYTGNADLQEQWGPLFQLHGVDVYVSGHDHNLQQLEFDDWHSSFIVSGGGGARLYALGRPERAVFAMSANGFAHLEFTPQFMILRFLDLRARPVHVARREITGEVRVLSGVKRRPD